MGCEVLSHLRAAHRDAADSRDGHSHIVSSASLSFFLSPIEKEIEGLMTDNRPSWKKGAEIAVR
jgi:hypothetical protein